MANDFSPYNYMRGTQHTKIKPIGGREYLQVSLKKGCYGTDSSRGCGLYGRMPASPGKKPKTMTLEYTYASSALMSQPICLWIMLIWHSLHADCIIHTHAPPHWVVRCLLVPLPRGVPECHVS